MGWLGTIIGSGIGAVVAGPFGAIIGAAIGASMSNRNQTPQIEDSQRGDYDQARQQMLFFTAAFSMVGKLAKADGRVCEDEIAAIRRVANEVMGLDDATRRFAIEVMNQSKHSPQSFGDYARQFGELFWQQPEMCRFMMQFLFEVAMADGRLHPEEERMLLEAKAAFRLSDAVYQSLYQRHVGHQAVSELGLAAHYEVLGVSPDISDSELKKIYRQKVAEYHPDRIAGKGLPSEFIKFANDRLAEINTAYEAIRKARGI
ncbi:DnaJ like chaperone protein [Geothermobacter ehrlichii]|uniref:DnaJ like chaperone protein n=1 Tax=Geothermobacter ehrlichii TaxID=213224 RepID=A0A5D3WLL6_9BACT|nr:co-chaperone DjlA [Geothermobacter ehrlichii]TYO98897.1 DnaJ like chaperone protein [Geothermobacter ehrlichii]